MTYGINKKNDPHHFKVKACSFFGILVVRSYFSHNQSTSTMSDFNDFNNQQVAKLPKHLRQFIVEQNYEKYTPVDQAVWRYVMRQNYSYLKHVAFVAVQAKMKFRVLL